MSKPACYRCPDHGRVAIPVAGRAASTAPCPTCGLAMKRDPRDRKDLRFVAVPAATYERIRTDARDAGMSMGAVIDVITQDLGGAP